MYAPVGGALRACDAPGAGPGGESALQGCSAEGSMVGGEPFYLVVLEDLASVLIRAELEWCLLMRWGVDIWSRVGCWREDVEVSSCLGIHLRSMPQ